MEGTGGKEGIVLLTPLTCVTSNTSLTRMKAFIFDFDGVIVDSQKYWDSHTMELYRALVPGWNETDNLRPKGMSVPDSFAMLRREYGYTGSKEEFVRHFDAFALDLYLTKAHVIGGIEALIERLEAMHIPIGISTASRSDWLQSALEHHGLHHHFAAASCEDDVLHSKPKPDVYLLTAKKLGVDPATCVALEDTVQGLTAAKAAGMYCIALQTADHLAHVQDLSIADKIISHPDELTEEVLRSL